MKSRMKGIDGLVAAVLIAVAGPVAADWGELAAGGAQVASLASVSVAAPGPARALVAGVRTQGGRSRVFLVQAEGGVWTAANGGQPADGDAATGPVRAPVLAADDAGHVALVFARHDGVSAWRLYGRRFDGVAMQDLGGAGPADAPVAGGTVNAFAAVCVPGNETHVLYTQFDGSRMALRAAWCADGDWQQANSGGAVDQGGAGWADAVAVARDGADGAVAAYTQETVAGRRLFALALSGAGPSRVWKAIDGGVSLDRADLGQVLLAGVAAMAGNRVLVAYVQEDGAGIPRLFGVVRVGGDWTRLNGGDPIDANPAGVGDLAVSVDATGGAVIAYVTTDAVQGVATPRLFALSVRGLAVAAMNGGAALDTPAGGVEGLDLAAGALVFEAPAGAMYARGFTASAAPAAAAAMTGPAAPVEGLAVSGAVFRPGAGERAALAWTVASAQDVRVTITSIAGEPVAVLADGAATGRVAVEWDGRDAAGRDVAPGVYVVRARGWSFRQSAKLVVVR